MLQNYSFQRPANLTKRLASYVIILLLHYDLLYEDLFLEVEDDRTFDVAIQKVLYLHNIMHTFENSINESDLYHIHIKNEVRFTAKSAKNK